MRSKNLHFIVLALFLFYYQCTLGQCSSCTVIITGNDNNNYTLGPSDKLCIMQGGVYNGHTLELDGGDVCNMGVLRPKVLILTHGLLDNSGMLTAGQLHMKNTNTIINNHGTINVRSLFSMVGGIINNNSIFNVNKNLHFDGDMFYNHGTLNVQEDLTINALMENSSNGFIQVGKSMNINTPGLFKNSSCVKINQDFTNNSTVEGAVNGCGSFEINGVSSNFGVFGQVGSVDFCDNGAPFGGFDQIAGLVGPAVTHCTCGTGPCFKTGSFFPVEMTYFDVSTTTNKTNLLQWSTSSETNNDYFTVERSTDAIEFEALATVDGAGTTTEAKYYEWIDKNALTGTSYYRIKQTDYDGSFSYSEIKSVFIEPYAEPVVYPNPTKEILNITLPGRLNQNSIIQLYDEIGVCVKQFYANSNYVHVDMKELASGMYFLQIRSNDDGQPFYGQKIIKN